MPEREKDEVRDVFKAYDLKPEQIEAIVDKMAENPDKWVDFMMKFELGLEKPEKGRSLKAR